MARRPSGRGDTGGMSLEWFGNRSDARIVVESWRRGCNVAQPYSSLGSLTPSNFVRRRSTTRPAEAIFQV